MLSISSLGSILMLNFDDGLAIIDKFLYFLVGHVKADVAVAARFFIDMLSTFDKGGSGGSSGVAMVRGVAVGIDLETTRWEFSTSCTRCNIFYSVVSTEQVVCTKMLVT